MAKNFRQKMISFLQYISVYAVFCRRYSTAFAMAHRPVASTPAMTQFRSTSGLRSNASSFRI